MCRKDKPVTGLVILGHNVLSTYLNENSKLSRVCVYVFTLFSDVFLKTHEQTVFIINQVKF